MLNYRFFKGVKSYTKKNDKSNSNFKFRRFLNIKKKSLKEKLPKRLIIQYFAIIFTVINIIFTIERILSNPFI